MKPLLVRSALPRSFAALVAVYFIASLAHFSHNAEAIAFDPGMPAWLTREKVYLAWLAVSAVGALGIALLGFGWYAPALLVFGVYGAFGLDSLAHYALALCSEHTLAANVTIWAEAATGLALLLASAVLLSRRAMRGSPGR